MSTKMYEDGYANSRAIDYQKVDAISINPYRLLVTAIVILGFTLILIWSRVSFVAENYRMSAVASETQALTQQIDQYNLEIATLKSRARIENIARTDLGLGYPGPKQMVLIDR
ncbi:MAG: cell division protein FtsL [Deltaproteobacteria bacterium]|nr:cell division protein FtsL [Deltaproteobacteria bacterium]MCL5278112.1 cell division protein FtsL [Deltaproteobacteria bacterium]